MSVEKWKRATSILLDKADREKALLDKTTKALADWFTGPEGRAACHLCRQTEKKVVFDSCRALTGNGLEIYTNSIHESGGTVYPTSDLNKLLGSRSHFNTEMDMVKTFAMSHVSRKPNQDIIEWLRSELDGIADSVLDNQ